MSDKLNKFIKTNIDDNSDIVYHILSFFDLEIATFHEYYFKELSYKEDNRLNIARKIVNDVWEDKQSLIVIYEDNDKTSVSYFMVSHDDEDSFVMRHGSYNRSYKVSYPIIKGKSKETLEDSIIDELFDIWFKMITTKDDEKDIKNMIPIEKIEVDNDEVEYHIMNHIYSFFDDTFSVYRIDMLAYSDTATKYMLIPKQSMIYNDIENCIKTKKNTVIIIPNDIVGTEYTYILGKYYDKLYHIGIGRYDKSSYYLNMREMIVTQYLSKNIDFITLINSAISDFNTSLL